MFTRRNFMILLSTFSIGALLWGCAAPPPAQAPRFPWGQPVDFDGISFDFNSARTDTSFTNWLNQQTIAADAFVIVEVTMMNKTGSPLPRHFQPVFRLLDSTGAIYEPHPGNTMMINLRKPGRVSSFQNMNPNTNLKQELVFEVPRRKYDLQVIVPSRARVGFAGSVTSIGPYFLLDIASQLTAPSPAALPPSGQASTSAPLLAETSAKDVAATVGKEAFPRDWKSLTSGGSRRLTFSADSITGEVTNLPRGQVRLGAYARYDIKKEGDKWLGTQYVGRVCAQPPKLSEKQQVKLCRFTFPFELSLVTPTRIEGIAELPADPRVLDCETCADGGRKSERFIWVPAQ